MVKNTDIDKYCGYGIGFDTKGTLSIPSGGGTGRNVIIFGADMSYSVHIDKKGSNNLVLCEGPTQGLNGTTYTAEKKYSINFTEHDKNFCLSLHYNGAHSYLFVNGVQIIKIRTRTIMSRKHFKRSFCR